MIFNVKGPRAQARVQAVINRRQVILERNFRKRVRAMLNQQYAAASRSVARGNMNTDAVVDSSLGQMRRVFAEEYTRAAETFYGIVDQSVRTIKSGHRADEFKGMKDEFWARFFGYVRKQVAKKVAWVGETTKANIRSIIELGKADGKSVELIAEDIWSSTTQDFNFKRAVRIARTEVHAATNTATQAAVESTGLTGLTREWIAMADERVRSDHRKAHGQLRGMDESFDVGGEKLDFPGDPKGSGGNVINCIAAGRTPIFTSKGWKRIKEIKVGDLVLTHKNRFRKVERVKNRLRNGELIRISTDRKHITVTPEHPLMVNGKWTEAKDIRQGDNISVLAAFCEVCGESIPYWNRCHKACSSRRYANKQRESEEHRANISKKTSAQMKRELADGTRDAKTAWNKGRKVCFDKYGKGGVFSNKELRAAAEPKRIAAINEKYGSVTNMLIATSFPALGRIARSGGSKLEQAMSTFLKRKNKEFIAQFPIGRRRVDFYVENEKLFIEVDGHPFHEDKEKERKRDLEILMQYPDHKIAHVTYKTSPPSWEYFDLLQLNHAGTYDQIEVPIKSVEVFTPVKSRRVYNFAVEEDESYNAGGFISHNCRCVVVYNTGRGDDRTAARNRERQELLAKPSAWE